MSLDWRSLPAVVAPSKPSKIRKKIIKPSDSQSNSSLSNSESRSPDTTDQEHSHSHTLHNNDNENESIITEESSDSNSSDSDSNSSHNSSNSHNSSDEHEQIHSDNSDSSDSDELTQTELRRQKRREKHLAKIKEVYCDYLSDGSHTTNSTNETDLETDTQNPLATVKYRPPTKVRGCPHWKRGCKFEGNQQSLAAHMSECCFEKMKAMIKKRDHQISRLQNTTHNLQAQVHQLHSLLSSFISLQTPQLQSYLVSHLPTEILSDETQQSNMINLNRNLSSELYDAPHSAINLSLHGIDNESTRLNAYQRREMNREAIHKHEISIGGNLGLIWRSIEQITDLVGINKHYRLSPTVNFINNNKMNRLTLPMRKNKSETETENRESTDLAIQCLCLFWNKVISTSDMGIQIWDILKEESDEKDRFDRFYGNSRRASKNRNAKIKGLSHNAWLFDQSSFGIATQPFAHPYWLFTGHNRQIRIWKYNGFSFNTTCNCNACSIVFSSEGYGDVRCIAVSSDYIFASSDSNLIQFWEFTKTNSSNSKHSNALDQRINAVGNIEYLGNLVCGHRGMITSLKVFGDILISGSKDGFITIWSATQLINLSILHYGANPVLDFTIFPNPDPLCHITIWNEHLNALKKLRNTNDSKSETESDINHRSKEPKYVSLNSLYNDIPTKEKTAIQDTILDFCGHRDTDDILNSDDAPDVLKSVFLAAMPDSTPSHTPSDSDTNMNHKTQMEIKRVRNKVRNSELSREIMCNASSHGFKGISFFIKDMKLIVGGRSGEIHIWHIGNTRNAFNDLDQTTSWEKETILRGHGDRVTCLESFGTHLMSAYSNGSIKLWTWNNSDFVCNGTAYTDPTKRVGSADTIEEFGGYQKISNSYNSVRSVLLLPSPSLNLNRNIEDSLVQRNNNAWSSCNDELESDDCDDMDSFNEFNVKISSTNGKKKKKNVSNNTSCYKDNEFWILSGTSNGSMLLYNNSNNLNYL